MSSAPRGLAPREGLEFVLVKMGRAGPPFEPRRRPQAGKSGDPRSQNTDRNAMWRLMECAPFVDRKMSQIIMHLYAAPMLETRGML
mgnify:CR=1 FL=1